MGLGGQVMTRTSRLRGWEPCHAAKNGRALPYVPQPVATSVGACCLMGFWGVPNFGDEWLFRAGQSFLRAAFPDCRLSALVGSARVERRLGRHADGLALLDGFFPDPAFFKKLPAIVQAIRTADLMLIGGGGLINDTYTSFSIPRYVVPALLATALGTPVVWWGLGVVPPRRRVLRSLAMWSLRHAAALLTRDQASRAYLQENGIAASLSEDLSVLGPAARSTVEPERATVAGRSLVVNFRDDRQDLAAGRLAFLEAQLDRFDRVVLVAAEPCDEPVHANLLDELIRRRPLVAIEVLPATAYTQIQETLAAASQVVSERLHVSLFALASGVPTTVLSYERKVDEVVGRLYPSVRITSRERFWTEAAAWAEAGTVSSVPEIDVSACKQDIAAQLRLASRRPASVSVRIAAMAWLALLLPAGAMLAAGIWLKRMVVAARKSGVRVDRQGAPVTLLEPANP